MLGPPASGKGTQGRRLAEHLGVPHVSTGWLLRRSIDDGDPHGVRDLVMQGRKVPDDVVEAVLVPALADGFVLDGYPRTHHQAHRLDVLLEGSGRALDAAIELTVDEETLVVRMVMRADAEKRSDDRPEVFMHRLDEYRSDILGLRKHYGDRLVAVDSHGDPDEVFERLALALHLTSPARPRR
ncbi:MAG TPA: nucleoside monophosphate kinase [Actinomycetota bacterium]